MASVPSRIADLSAPLILDDFDVGDLGVDANATPGSLPFSLPDLIDELGGESVPVSTSILGVGAAAADPVGVSKWAADTVGGGSGAGSGAGTGGSGSGSGSASAATLAAVEEFATFKSRFEEDPPHVKTKSELLVPSQLLSKKEWLTFSRHVRTFPKWSVSRRPVEVSGVFMYTYTYTPKRKLADSTSSSNNTTTATTRAKKPRRKFSCQHCGGTDHQMVTSKKCKFRANMAVKGA